MKLRRELWLDVAKMIGILLVVYGHSSEGPQSITFIYWFHMPLFFIISGYLFKTVDTFNELKFYIKKLICKLLVPYCTYLILFTFYRHVAMVSDHPLTFSSLGHEILKLFIGGRFITSIYGVFWYITCLFFTQILFALICLYFKKDLHRILIVIGCYLIAHFETVKLIPHIGENYFNQITIPWNMDVALIAVCYLAFGYFTKTLLSKIPNYLGAVSLLLSVIFMTLYEMNIIDYHLSLKYLKYDHLFLDAVIPLTMTIAFFYGCQKLTRLKMIDSFTILGRESLTIMYIHIFANMIFSQIFEYGPLLYTIIGIVVPLLLKKFIIEALPTIRPFFIGLSVKRSSKVQTA